MNNVTEIDSETLFYIKGDGGQIVGVGDSCGLLEFINNDVKGTVNIYHDGVGDISKVKLQQLFIAWLALNFPDVLHYDEEEEI